VNKKVNTVLFVIAATVFNVLIMTIILVAGLAIMGIVLPEKVQESGGQVLFIILFLVSIGGAFFSYNLVVRIISKKIDLDRYFHPIFSSRRRPRS